MPGVPPEVDAAVPAQGGGRGRDGAQALQCGCRYVIRHGVRGTLVLVEVTAESVSSAYLQVSDVPWFVDPLGEWAERPDLLQVSVGRCSAP